MSKNTIERGKDAIVEVKESTKFALKTSTGKLIAGLAVASAVGGTIELASSINVVEDKAAKEMAAQNRQNFFRYTMLQDPKSLHTHGACAPELAAEAEYFSGAAKIVGPDRGIYEGSQPMNYKYLNDNAKIYKKSAKLAGTHDTSCFPANSKISNLTPHFDLNEMSLKKQCAEELKAIPQENVLSKPTQLERDMASAKNLRLDIATNLAKSQNIAC